MAKSQAPKPLISIDRDVMVRRSYSVQEEIATVLDEYAAFLSAFNGSKVTPGDIVGKLAAKLGKDPAFMAWKSTPAAAVAATAAKASTAQKDA